MSHGQASARGPRTLSAPRWRVSRGGGNAVPVTALLALPILLALIHDDWIYTNVYELDAWFNLGYFLNYFDPAYSPLAYKESRLSWLSVGYVLFQVLPPLLANFVLHVGSLAATAVLVYLALSRLVSRNAAFAASALLTLYNPMHGSGGWDYQTTPGGLYFAATLYLLVMAARSDRPFAWLAGAGAAFAAALHADILFVNLLLGLTALYVVAGKRPVTLESVCLDEMAVFIGAVILTVLLGLFAFLAGRDPVFFRSIINIVAAYTSDTQNMARWWRPWSSGWFLGPNALAYLTPLAAIAAASFAALLATALRVLRTRARLDGEGRVRAVLLAQYVFAFLLWIFWQSLGHTALQPSPFAYPLIIPAFLALAALMGSAGRRDVIGVVVAAAAALLGATLLSRTVSPLWTAQTVPWFLAAIFVAAIAAGALVPKARTLALIAAFAGYALCYPKMNGTAESIYPGLWQVIPAADKCSNPRRIFLSLIRTEALLDERSTGHTAWVWLGPEELAQNAACGVSLTSFRTALSGLGVAQLNTSPLAVQDLAAADIVKVRSEDQVVAVVEDEAQLDALVIRFREADEALSLQHAERLNLGPVSAHLAVFKVGL